MPTKHDITCALRVSNHAQNVEMWGQCPVHISKAPMESSSSMLGDSSVSVLQKRVQSTTFVDLARGHMLALFIMALCFLIPYLWMNRKGKVHKKEHGPSSSRGAGKWKKKLLLVLVLLGVIGSIWSYWFLNQGIKERREETLANMCDERARMLQDQFNVSMNHVHALAILVSTFYHGKQPPAIDQVIISYIF